MFIGRKKELESLEKFYEKENFGMNVIYGRRRIGKSTLIKEFSKNKKTIYYTATKVGSERNLELFSEAVLFVLEPDLQNVTFNSFEALLDFFTKKLDSSNEKLLLVIDELPYWAEKDESLLSVFQKYIDEKWLNKNLKIILCGSSLSFMENKVLCEKSPLFGRRDSQIKLEPFDYKETALFVSDYTFEEKAIVYGITGGVAKYLSMINPKLSLDENIVNQFFKTDGYLYDETKNLLTQEFSDITLVNNIIEQIAQGQNQINQIASKLNEKDQLILYSLEKLISVGLVEKKLCITEEKNRKKTQYVLKDSMFKFWYQFIPKAVSIIEIGKGEIYFEKVVKNQIHNFMGSVFEEMCRHFTLEKGIEGYFGNFVTNVGTWWGMENLKKEDGTKFSQSTDIDVVALSETDFSGIVGECKFKNEKIDKEIFETLQRRSNLIGGKYRISKFVFFSLSGYTKWFEEMNDSNVFLLTLKDLYS